jgi:Ca2+-binding EF-hand superfamily protein
MNIFLKAFAVCFLMIYLNFLLTANAQSEEVLSRGSTPFHVYDKDNNGIVSANEFNIVRWQRMSLRAAVVKPTRGVISEAYFSQFDTNGNGQLTRHELSVGQMAQMKKRQGIITRQQSGKGHRKKKSVSMLSLSEYDLNGDGRLLEKEFNKARDKQLNKSVGQGYHNKSIENSPSFPDIDLNGNAEISPEEFNVYQLQKIRRK